MMRLFLLFFMLMFALLTSHFVQANTEKQIVGATEKIMVEEAKIAFMARIDSGAKTSSIHAEAIDVAETGDAVGQPISFYIVNKHGERVKINTQVAAITTIRTSEGAEQRFKVWLTIEFNHVKKPILVTLNNRDKMKYALLLGRNWLHGDYIVDVDKNSDD